MSVEFKKSCDTLTNLLDHDFMMRTRDPRPKDPKLLDLLDRVDLELAKSKETGSKDESEFSNLLDYLLEIDNGSDDDSD
ncbi:hypothetical protein CE11_00067 [Megavirus courdo11]|uniref:Uncharacterized protein n=1 Tax=Megavirus courdo11 TaxID=1128140 RepID=K7YG27_9VIRU|nr:hypothetical protein CE11_00067 [Megavirus courdo11]